MLEYLIEKDKALLLLINTAGNENYDSFWFLVSHKFSALPLYLYLLFLCFYFFKWKKTLIILVSVALMITFSDQIANIFKYGVARLRPCHDETLISAMRMVTCGGKYGYFSAHAGNTMAVATLFSLLFYKKVTFLPFLLFFWSFLVGISRIYLGMHFPFDVLTGFFIGGILGFSFYKILIKIIKFPE